MSIVNEKKPWPNRAIEFQWGEAIVLVCLVGVDQFTKYWFQMRDLVVMNAGGVFGIFPSLKWMLLWLVWMLLVWEWQRMGHGWARWGMGCIVAGGLGNLLDRVLFGSVRDFIYYPVFGFYGNGADILLAIGVCILVSVWIFSRGDRITS